MFDQVVVEFRNYNKYGYGGSNKACSWDLKKNITYKTVFVAGFSEINKRGGSNKACSWENFLKKNKKNSMLIRDFRVHM